MLLPLAVDLKNAFWYGTLNKISYKGLRVIYHTNVFMKDAVKEE
jgi:hypothetical protein